MTATRSTELQPTAPEKRTNSWAAYPKTIAAQGKERSRLTATWFAGIALLLLIVLYGVSVFVKGIESHELLTLIGTVFGIFVGKFAQRGD